VVLGLINCSTQSSTAVNIKPLNETALASTTAISAAATSAGVFYTPNGTTLTSKAFRIIGWLEYSSGLTTAGTYASAPTTLQLFGPGCKKPGDVVQTVMASTTSTTATGASDTTKHNLTNLSAITITPTSAVNPVKVTLDGALSCTIGTAAYGIQTQIFRGTNATPIGNTSAAFGNSSAASGNYPVYCFAYDSPQSTSSVTYGAFIANTVSTGNSAATFLGTGNNMSANTGVMTIEEVMG
jgi:hypothetical protein